MNNLARLEDLEAIRQMRIEYTHCYDSGDIDGVVASFTADGSVEAGRFGRAVGSHEIRTYYLAAMSQTKKGQHLISNPKIEFTGQDSARGKWYLTDIIIHSGAVAHPPIVLIGFYDDIYQRVNGVWKMKQMQVTILWPTDLMLES